MNTGIYSSQEKQDTMDIWFRLLFPGSDGNTIRPATKVTIPSTADVDNFRDAVKDKLSIKLSFVDSDDLIVYKNLAAFNSNISLEAMDPLNGCGEDNEDNAVMVIVVPFLPVAPPNQQNIYGELKEVMLEVEQSARRVFLEMQQCLQDDFYSLTHRVQSKSYTPGGLGSMTLSRLRRDKFFVEALPITNEDAFWSNQDQEIADKITNEAELVKFITPFFNDLLNSKGMVFVNSERYQWLPQYPSLSKQTDLNPDGFATHCGMYHVKEVPNDGLNRDSRFLFGVAEPELFDCLIMFESNLKITDDTFGQVVLYLQYINLIDSAAILFDRESFWLIKSHLHIVTKVVKAMWVNDGSKQLFEQFIVDNMSPWITRLTNACNELKVAITPGDSFLGRGAYGRVFKVKREKQGKSTFFALKIVEEKSIHGLYQENKALEGAYNTGLTISCTGQCIEISGGGGALLLSPVGKSISRPTSNPEIERLFILLWELHIKGVIHGDPRVPNVIQHGEKLLWIDLVGALEARPFLCIHDAEILTRSILRTRDKDLLDNDLMELINKYGNKLEKEHLNFLIAKVCEKIQKDRFLEG